MYANDMEKRLEQFKNFSSYFPTTKYTCVKGFKYLKFENWIGSGIYGDVYGVTHSDKKVDQKQVSKLRKRNSRTKPNYDFVVKFAYNSLPHRREIAIGKTLSKLVENKICPYFPLFHKSYICKNLEFRGQGVYPEPHYWEKVKKGEGLIQFVEYVGISLEDWMKRRHSSEAYSAMICQVLIAIYAMKTKHNINHNDLYISNITMMYVDKPCYHKFSINGNEYIVPVYNWYPVIIDFGQSSKHVKKQCYSEDVFQFLSDFCVGENGTRPSTKRGKIKTTCDLPPQTAMLIKKILYNMLRSCTDFNTNDPVDYWIRTRYLDNDAILQKFFLKDFSKQNFKNWKVHKFKI